MCLLGLVQEEAGVQNRVIRLQTNSTPKAKTSIQLGTYLHDHR